MANPQEQLKQQILALVAQYGEEASRAGDFVPGSTPVPPSGKMIGAREMQV